MAAILTAASTITCPNGGTAHGATSSKLKVAGSAVLIVTATPWTISNCGNTNATCATVSSIPQASKLKSGGMPVALDGAPAASNTSVPLTIVANDSKLAAS